MGKKNRQQSYIVKDIIDYKIENKQEFFLVWWQGYPKKDATWEPITNVQDLYDFQTFYQKLKKKYQKKTITINQSKEESQQQSSVKDHSDNNKGKTKQIIKLKKGLKQKKQKDQPAPSESPPINNYLIAEPTQVIPEIRNVPKPPQKKIELLGVAADKEGDIKSKLLKGSAVKFEIKIKQFKDLPFIGQKLKKINQQFIRGQNMMYQVQLESIAFPQPVILHEKYIKVLWPRQFAQYLLTKIKG